LPVVPLLISYQIISEVSRQKNISVPGELKVKYIFIKCIVNIVIHTASGNVFKERLKLQFNIGVLYWIVFIFKYKIKYIYKS
jgi:hypothetical protein